MKETVDILAIGAHPDDVELGASGTVIKHVEMGRSVALLDLTQGELGTRGTPEIRAKEAKAAAKILGASYRHQLNLGDGFFEASESIFKEIMTQIRRFRPEIVIANAIRDRHPDHGRASEIVSRACFLSGLTKIETTWDNQIQEEWRPKAVYHFVQDRYIKPDLVVDVTPFWEKRMESVLAYKSQFYDPNSQEKDSPISGKDFLSFLEGRALNFGRSIGVKYGEGFTVERPVGIHDLTSLQ